MTVPPFMSRAWAFLFNNVYAHDVHKRRLTLRIIRFRHLRPPLPQERTTGSPYPSRRTIIRTGSVASLLRPGPPPGLTLFGGLAKTGCVRLRRPICCVPRSLMYVLGQRPAPRTSAPCALQMGLRLLGGFVAATALRSGLCTSSRPKARTAHCAIACLVSAPSAGVAHRFGARCGCACALVPFTGGERPYGSNR